MDLFQANSRSKKSSNKKKGQTPNNFIEALKDIGDTAKKQAKDATLGTGRGVIDQIFSTSSDQSPSQEANQDKPFDFEAYLKSREKPAETDQTKSLEKRIRQERLLFSAKEQQTRIQIKSIQEELKKLASETGELNQEIKKAVFNTPVETGTYYLNFFDRIKRLIEVARKKIASSRTWLAEFNRRNKRKKQCFFWAQAKKSGTRFTLSQERSSALKG
jgi:hypothetical protein